MPFTYHQLRQQGFTLIEVMAVLVIMGLIISMVSLNFSFTSSKEELHKEARRFQAVFDMAADMALFNSVELGLEILNDNEYRFLILDDNNQWQIINQDKALQTYKLPENFSLKLELEDFPWQNQQQLFDQEDFSTEEFKLDEEDEKPPFPQVFIFSSGDISPFILSFNHLPEFGNEQPSQFDVAGEYSTPLSIEEVPL